MHDGRRGMDIHHGLNGGRRFAVERADHSRVFGERGRRGFVEHGYGFHGHDFARRSYFDHGHAYSRYYHGYHYHGMDGRCCDGGGGGGGGEGGGGGGIDLSVFAPGAFFPPALYGWAYNPFPAAFPFEWGWAGSPWYAYYGGFFEPYPMYSSAAYWLTDYLISQDLQSDYQAHMETGEMDGEPMPPGGPVALAPDVKQQIATEVRSQLALENMEAAQNASNQDIDPGSSGIARMLSDGHKHTFVVGSPLDVLDATQTECSLSSGDVLALHSPPSPSAPAINLVVLASKGGHECAKLSTVTIQFADLQEMQNHMRETVDQGLAELRDRQGTGGLPKLPPSAQSQPVPAHYAEIAPPPDPNVGSEIQEQDQQVEQAEKDVSNDAPQTGGAQ
ncbi:MAG: hypothetical protein ABSE55_02700 [Terracidiphilus sp.]